MRLRRSLSHDLMDCLGTQLPQDDRPENERQDERRHRRPRRAERDVAKDIQDVECQPERVEEMVEHVA